MSHLAPITDNSVWPAQVTPVKALVGTGGTSKTVLGMLRRDDSKGKVYVEDATGVAQLANLQAADCSATLGYISDGCCVLLQGALQPNQTFRVTRVFEAFMESQEQAVGSLRGRCLSGAHPLRYAPRPCGTCCRYLFNALTRSTCQVAVFPRPLKFCQ